MLIIPLPFYTAFPLLTMVAVQKTYLFQNTASPFSISATAFFDPGVHCLAAFIVRNPLVD